MVALNDEGARRTAWCPGCGNHALLASMKKALDVVGLEPRRACFVSGIGQAAKAPHALDVNIFNGLHGRALPAATGIRLANPELVVIAESGDGCSYGEGGNHFLAAIRRNIDITLVVHNNQIYGLTKGQASPTTDEGTVTKAQPDGVVEEPFNPLLVAVALRAGFVARSFTGMPEHVTEMIARAIRHRGFSLVDVLQPCVTFNKVNTFAWYRQRCQPLPAEYDPRDWPSALRAASEWGERIPVGVIFESDRPSFEDRIGVPRHGAPDARQALAAIMASYG